MDFTLEHWVNGAAGTHPLWDGIMKAAALLAEPVFVALVAAWFLAGWLGRRRQDRFGALAALIAAGGALLVNQAVSHLWERPRPFVTHPGVQVLLDRSTDPSFPSDHAAAAFAIAAVLVAIHRRLGAVALVLAAVIAYARVYVGEHYPGDVAAGAVVGALVAVLLLTWLRPIPSLALRLSDGTMARLRLLGQSP